MEKIVDGKYFEMFQNIKTPKRLTPLYTEESFNTEEKEILEITGVYPVKENKNSGDQNNNEENQLKNQPLSNNRYKKYSEHYKQLVVDSADKFGGEFASKKYSVPLRTLKHWQIKKNKTKELKDDRCNNGRQHDEELDIKLVSFIKELRSKGIPVYGNMVKCKAFGI